MTLREFMDQQGASLADVSRFTGIQVPTLSRIASGDVVEPRIRTALRIQRWADEEARVYGLAGWQRFTWDYLLD